MNILAEIHRSESVNIHGRTIHRHAVRAVILRGRELLMIYSAKVGDYKFPGGGVDKNESHEQALVREVKEECGMSLRQVGDEICRVVEYDLPMEPEYDVFKMASYYYDCEVHDGFGSQKLDDYELNLGFEPVWIDLDQALELNKILLNVPHPPKWLDREVLVLEYLKQKFPHVE
jgi:8-oxo-dGTP pyrophosphatase MutT (NUDIX family)